MRSRIATSFTVVVLLAGTGGTIALGAGAGAGGVQAGAASGQYKPGKGCGKPGQHTGAPGNKGNTSCPPVQHVKAKRITRSKKTKHPKKRPHPTGCKFKVVGKILIAYCPLP